MPKRLSRYKEKFAGPGTIPGLAPVNKTLDIQGYIPIEEE
jgi:hypothetical protein